MRNSSLSRRGPRTAFLAFASAASLLLAGCGSDAGPGTPDDASARPVDGGTLRYVVAGSPATASDDPHGGLGNESDVMRFALTYDVLTVPGPNGEPRPRLAVSWKPNKTLDRWTFRLRENAEFTDGRPVRAKDVLYSLTRIAKKAAENYGRLADFDLESSTAPDDHTVVLATRAPMAEAPKALESISFVVPDGSTDFSRPVPGSGPYRVVGTGAQTAVLTRNKGWWGTRPHLDRIEIRAVADPQARASAVTSGQADVAGSVSPAAVKSAKSSSSVRIVTRQGVTEYPFIMRLDTKPFDNPKVREAFRLAADRKALVDTVFLGYGRIANDLPTPYDPSYPKDLKQRTRDVARAKRLLKEAGHAHGLKLTLHTTTSYPGMDTAATLYAEQLADIGVDAEVKVEPADTYWTRIYAKKDFYTGYYGGISFADLVRVGLLSDSPTNETAWRSRTFDTGFTRAMGTLDARARNAALARIQKELWRNGGYVVWGTGDGLDLAAPGVHGLPDGPGFQRMFIDRAWKAK
ncbi:ABC transporter substrate-binding protein [Streptomyces rugosispiralis]|uniref:ABC transporter substrate-binding protein n=1 Tax=Streptomyces rugosispiralis TaxID=2967341 RepID=A0ABT1VAS1_9ACTN|nr:ABC transporter substrate-binding protein [Streptomyces rugosispiralis]MCQ8193860.1 ABC transporter substrate-binding protein [Streptomyces rugosispiralis]